MLAMMALTLRCLALVVVVEEEGYGAQPAPCLTVVLHPQHSPLLLWPLPLPLLLVPLARPPLMPRNASNSSSSSSVVRSHTAVHKGSQAALSLIHNSLTR